MVLLLLQKCVSRNAFGGLRRLGILQKAIEDRQRLRFVLRFDQQVKQVAVIDGRPLWLILPRVEVAERLTCFRMLWS